MRRPSFLYAHPSGGRLYVSGRGFGATTLDALGITMVLSAVEPPPFIADSPVVTALRCLFDDDRDVRPDAALARSTTAAIAEHVAAGGGALVHCGGGYNRSPYLAALVLERLGLSRREAVELILGRHSREALTNEGLARALVGRAIRDDERGRRPRR